MSNFFTNLFSVFSRKPAAQTTPTPLPEFRNYRKVFLREDDLEWRSFEFVENLLGCPRMSRGIDASNVLISGARLKRSTNHQDEGQPGIRVHLDEFKIRGCIFSDIPGGVKLFGSGCLFADANWINIGEDAISTFKGASFLKITDSNFYNNRGGDKSIQLNDARGAVLTRVNIYSGETGIRLGKKQYGVDGGHCALNDVKFTGCATAINVDAKTTVSLNRCKFTGVGKKYVVQPGSKIKVFP